MGPPIVELFRAEGAEVQADDSDLSGPGDAAALVEGAGRVDVLVANFAGPREAMPVTNMMGDTVDVTAGERLPGRADRAGLGRLGDALTRW